MTSLGMHWGRKAEAAVEAGLHSLSCGVSPEWALPVTGASTQSRGQPICWPFSRSPGVFCGSFRAGVGALGLRPLLLDGHGTSGPQCPALENGYKATCF